MVIESVDLKNYRNYKYLNMVFDDKINIIYGDNAQGKTNILEALYVCATSRSHRGNKDKEIIQFGDEEAHIKVQVKKNDINYRIDMHLKKNKAKGIAVNGIPIKKAVELFGIINIVFFSPEDLNIIKDGPSERRRFIDMELSQLDKIYLNNLVNYNKVVVQRNKLLKELSFCMRKDYLDTLDVWDMQLVKYGTEVIKAREEFVKKINDIIKDIHSRLSGDKENLRVEYVPCVSAEMFEKEVIASREKDIKLKSTGVGPHKDDCVFYINDKDVKKYGSQGQQRTVALSLKLAEIELVKKIIHDTPVLLLDDVLSELDSNRQNFLLNSIGDIQTIVTCTGLDEFINNRMTINKIFKVVNGEITDYKG
ncbi:MAG: DNA replication/repair protein RecF [Lachnospira sp.]|nr:DNA replication/repair protein RecF [Lachnospira sp.]